MPIQFPRPTGPVRSYIEQRWLRAQSKAFDVVPAPNMGRPGAPLASSEPLGKRGWSLNPGIGLPLHGTYCGAGGAAANVRRPSTMFQAPDQVMRQNRAANLRAEFDTTGGWDSNLGEQGDRIVGVSRDAGGAALGGCTVKVFRTEDDVLVASTVSDGSGNWTAYPNQRGPYYYVEYKAGAPDVFGTSPNTNTSAPFTPGQ